MSSFDELAEQFRAQFVTNIPPAKSIHDLRVCKQEANESLKSYLDRFNKVAMQIQNLSDKTAIEAMKNGMRLGRLKDDIMVQEPSTFTEAMAMATKLIKMDEDRRLRREDDKMPIKNDDRSESRRPRLQRPFFRSSTGSIASGYQKEVEKYTPLNTPRSKVLMWIRANGVGIPRPRRLSPTKKEGADRIFYCQYHRDYGYDTDECQELQKAIE